MSKWEKLIQDILSRNKSLRFEDLAKVLMKIFLFRNRMDLETIAVSLS